MEHPQQWSLTFIAMSTAAATTIIIPTFLHHHLSSRITHSSMRNSPPIDLIARAPSIPAPAFAADTRTCYDTASIPIPANADHVHDGELLTGYLRRSMSTFAWMPQAWALRLVVPSSRTRTFSREYLQHASFEEGDIVCGLYRVARREHGQVELAIDGMGSIGGVLIIGIQGLEKGGGRLLKTETLQWVEEGQKGVMPLERTFLRWLHECASWGLLVNGESWMRGLGKNHEK